jgi:hypothetical protein
VPQPVGIVFKGSGWYVNDSRDAKKSTSKTSSDSFDKSAGDAKTKASDGKSATTESSEKKPAVATKES